MSYFEKLTPLDFKGNVFFGSDFHFNHANITGPTVSKWKDGFRNFESIEQMNEKILFNINNKVKSEDILVFHGDFCFGGHKLTPDWRAAINCSTIYWITGNHDTNAYLYRRYFQDICSYMEFSVWGQDITSFHYPILSWNGIGKGMWNLHGHVHAHPNIQRLNRETKRLDVGVDSYFDIFGDYNVFSFQEVKEIMDAKPIKIVDGHGANTNVK